MQTTSYSLGELLRRVRDQNLTIPQFQRKFIWSEAQVKLLVDSISRSYPIGSLLILDKKPELPLASRSIEAEIREDPPSDALGNVGTQTEIESYILDGQQRTTSIARVFLNAHPKKLYYVDLKSMLDLHPKEETSWIRVTARKTNPDRKNNNRLLRADLVLDQTKADIYVSEYIEDSGDFPEFESDRKAAREAAASIKGIFETIRNYKVPVVTLDRDRGVESVCRVFETINSTGTRLRTFDLAVARFFPEPDLRKLWEDALERFPILSEKGFDVDGERVLQVLYLVLAGREGKYPDPSRNNQLALTPDEINKEWARSSEALAITYQWAQAQGARPETLPNHNVLVALAAVHSLFSSEDLNRNIWPDHDFIRRWYFSKVIQAGASQASNYKIGQDFQALHRYIKEGIHPHPEDVVLNRDIILTIKPSDVRYKSLQNVFATTIRQDLTSGSNIDSESELHDHHIYPRNAHKKYGLSPKMLDSICNRIPILGTSNQSLNEAYPEIYFKGMADQAHAQGTLEGLQRRLHDCMIPGNPNDPAWPDSFALDKFEEFCRRRADLIVSRVREVIGESLKVNTLSEDEVAEEDED